MRAKITEFRKEFDKIDFGDRIEAFTYANKLLIFMEQNFKLYDKRGIEAMKKRIAKLEKNIEKYDNYILYMDKKEKELI